MSFMTKVSLCRGSTPPVWAVNRAARVSKRREIRTLLRDSRFVRSNLLLDGRTAPVAVAGGILRDTDKL